MPGYIKYKDDKGQHYTYDENGLLQGYFCDTDEGVDDDGFYEDGSRHECGDYWHGDFTPDSRY